MGRVEPLGVGFGVEAPPSLFPGLGGTVRASWNCTVPGTGTSSLGDKTRSVLLVAAAHLGDKGDHVAAAATTEAIPEALGWGDNEAARLPAFMNWAASPELRAKGLRNDAQERQDVGNIHASFEVLEVNEVGHRPLLYLPI